jgi:hypothetical protein
MEKIVEPFEFKELISIVKSRGRKAKNLGELWNAIEEASPESIFHHTYQYFLTGHKFEYTNDFAQWAGESLGERVLAEHLSSIDPYEFSDIQELRKKILDVIEDYLESYHVPGDVIPGAEFYFNETITMVFPASLKAHNIAEFLMAIRYIDAGSLYYHFYDARSRLGSGTDDFSKWFEANFAADELAKKIKAIDPFMHTMEGIRERITDAVEEEVRKEMEVLPL